MLDLPGAIVRRIVIKSRPSNTSYHSIPATAKSTVEVRQPFATFLNGTLVSNIVIDTSEVATDTIDYVATDQNGLTATSTRTVIIEAAYSAAATTTEATSTAQ